MKTLLAQMLFSWQSIAFMLGLAIAIGGVVWLQRRDLNRQLDASGLRTVHEIQKQMDQVMGAIQDLKEQNRQRVVENQSLIVDREKIHASVDQVKTQVNELKSEVKGKP